jgi:mannose-6-phosphate isomerase-like protein (cupin superfamily)
VRNATSKSYIGPGHGKAARVLASELEIKAGEEAGMSFGLFRSTFPPGTGMPFLHLHHSYEEAFYLLHGEVQFLLGDEEFEMHAGGAVLVPQGTAHCFRNVGDGEADWIAVTTPATAVTLIEEIAAVPRGDLEALAALLKRYDSELLERRPHWTDEPAPQS